MALDLAAAIGVVTLLALTRSVAAQIFLSLPATLLHELSHWVIALLTGCRPSLPSVWPKKTSSGWQLGNVSFVAGSLSAGWIALAPLWVLGAVCMFILTYQSEPSPVVLLGRGVVAGYCFWGMWPSSQDLFIALRYPLGTFACVAVNLTVVLLYAV